MTQAGDSFLVTDRGKPLWKITPAVETDEDFRAKEIAKLDTWLQKSLLVETDINWPDCFYQTHNILPKQSEKLGYRTLDLIHISITICYQAEFFITCDERPSKAAKAEGLKTHWIDIH